MIDINGRMESLSQTWQLYNEEQGGNSNEGYDNA
jgi:hypothetical protein